MEQQKQRWDPESGVSGTVPEVGPREWSGTAAAEVGSAEWI